MRSPPRSVPVPIHQVAEELGLSAEDYEPFGRAKAKVDLGPLEREPRGKGRLILVSAINPTPSGEGKTTTSIGLAMAMRGLGKSAILALRQPSLGPVFGVKGGGTGGGKASLFPADDINLHFTGDIHAITTAHNLLSALVDNAVFFGADVGGKGQLDARQITWGRALDMNDRFLRHCIVGLGGKAHGVPREEHFDITAASEIMAILALASSHADLEERLGRIVVGTTHTGAAVTASDLSANGAMTAILRDALLPNLVQTNEGGPALVHCGPFANIAHGCSSVLATRLALALGDYAVTEAGFGFDLGGEKFLDIKCRQANMWPRAVVVVATLRALKLHGGVALTASAQPDREGLRQGIAHLERHLAMVRLFGLEPVVAINVFPGDLEDELTVLEDAIRERGVRSARSEAFTRGGEGATELARTVIDVVDATDAAPPRPTFAYDLADPPAVKIEKVARLVYGARDIHLTNAAEHSLQRIVQLGGGGLPVCIAKTASSLTDDPSIFGSPRDFTITVRDVRLAAGAGFLVPITGDLMTMPGLPRTPSARGIHLLPDGHIEGLMHEH
jgi:formate--tetrahydrofolate ligase